MEEFADHLGVHYTTVTLNHPRFDALLASTVEALCAELRVKAPDWIMAVPGKINELTK